MKKKLGGLIKYYSLEIWWQNSFSESEQKYIIQKYKPLNGNNLIRGVIINSSISDINFLTGLQSYFSTLNDERISEIILKKAESLIQESTPILDIHFLYSTFINHYYKKRNLDVEFYELSKEYCKKQISINKEVKKAFRKEGFPSLPRHLGFEKLAIILEKEKDFNEAIKICEKAKSLHWNSDWDKRIQRIEKKKEKNNS